MWATKFWQRTSERGTFDWPFIRANKHPFDPAHPPRNDPEYPGFPGGKVYAKKKKRCMFGPKTKTLEDGKEVRNTWSGFLLCNQCNVAICNVHSANPYPICFQNLKYGHHD